MSQPNPVPSSTDAIHAIGRHLANPHFGTGSLAMLRRLKPAGALSEPALQRLLARHDINENPEGMRAWALLIHCMALAAPDGHRGGGPLGTTLFEAGFSEGRLTRLLEARGRDMLVVAPRVVRFLVARGQPLDPLGLWHLLRPTLLGRPGDAERAEHARTRIAADYYRAEAKAERAA
jgi:CRISPR system Cascade subunit CasB